MNPNRRTWTLLALALFLSGAYVFAFTDWLSPQPIEIASQRMAGAGRELDRFEQEQVDFHERVRAAYLARAAQMPQRVKVIDSRESLRSIQKQLELVILSI